MNKHKIIQFIMEMYNKEKKKAIKAGV